jgi:hypothetical protein
LGEIVPGNLAVKLLERVMKAFSMIAAAALAVAAAAPAFAEGTKTNPFVSTQGAALGAAETTAIVTVTVVTAGVIAGSASGS